MNWERFVSCSAVKQDVGDGGGGDEGGRGVMRMVMVMKVVGV